MDDMFKKVLSAAFQDELEKIAINMAAVLKAKQLGGAQNMLRAAREQATRQAPSAFSRGADFGTRDQLKASRDRLGRAGIDASPGFASAGEMSRGYEVSTGREIPRYR